MNRNSDICNILRYKHWKRLLLMVALFSVQCSMFNVYAQIVIGGHVYGGGNAGDTGGNTTVTVHAGDLDRVYGGARMADVKGRAFMHIDGANASSYIVINRLYGGNDIAGTIGKSREELPDAIKTHAAINKVDTTWNALLLISTKTNPDGTEATDAQKIYIGQLFGGGDGEYEYGSRIEGTTEDTKTVYFAKEAGVEVATSSTPLTVPNLGKTFVDIHGGSIVYAYGGGNNATITEKTVISVDNPSKVVNSIKDTTNPNADNTGELLTNDRFENKMDINTTFSYPGSAEYQIGRLFGGNNKADMAIRPRWNLQRGRIRMLYGGGNEGRMTSPEGLLMEVKGDGMVVDNVYGGCRKADVRPLNADGSPVADADIQLNPNDNPNNIPGGYAARVRVLAGDVNNVYGGNDISGNVYGGNTVGIFTNIHGNVYGGGNGSYAYTDNPKLKGDRRWGDFYYSPKDILKLNGDTFDGVQSAEALNSFRPNAEKVSILVRGTEDKPVFVEGALFVGGNSASLRDQSNTTSTNTRQTHIKIGSYVTIDNVFLGNNGENMIKHDEAGADGHGEGVLRTMKRTDITSDGSKFSLMNLEDEAVFAKYMEGCAMKVKPTVVFESMAQGDAQDYESYTTQFGSFYCGGNVGSLLVPGKITVDFEDNVIIYNKVVGGCNNANVQAVTGFNARYLGGLLGNPDPAPTGSPENAIGDKLELNLSGLKIQPKRWKDETDKSKGLEWNTYIDDTPVQIADNAPTGESSEDDMNRRFKGGNIYGGCYNSGHVNGNVIININASIVDRKGDDAIFDQIKENEGEAILYGNDSYKITARRSGVILDEQGMDVLGKALNVFGGGYGAESEIWGSTTVNLNKGYVFQVFGGGENGAIGKGTYNSTTGKLEYTYDPRYSCHVNLKGSQEGVYRGHADDSDDMADTEFIYGGSFEAPIAGNTIINLGNGRIFNSFAGSCNADILGHTETYIGRQKKEDGTYEDGGGFPWVRDHVYGGNDLGGQILNSASFKDRVSSDLKAMLHNPDNAENPDVVNASAYMEYIQGRVVNIFGGCYGDYDYTDPHYSKYTNDDGTDKPGFTKPRLDNAFVNLRPNNHTRNELEKVFGAGQGKSRGVEVDIMQNRSYILIDIPQNSRKYQNVEVYGAGANCGLGMAVKQTADATPDGKSIAENPDNASAIIDLMRGQISAAYGGSFQEGVTRRTVVNVPNGSTISLNNIFGGAYGADPLYPCDVYEAQVNYHSEDARVKTIYGGNNSADRTFYGQVNISAPVWQNKESGYLATVFGAGYGKDTWSQYTEVNLNSGARVYEVYGGGNSGKVLNLESLRKWRYDEGASLDLSIPGYETSTTYTDKDGKEFHLDAGLESPLAHAVSLDGKKYNTNIHIHQGATVVNYAYGGGLGADAVVSGTTYIDLLGGTVNKDIYAGGTSGAVEDYYKVGAKSDSNPYGFTATTTAYIEGGTVRNVYGGGWEGDVGYHDKSTNETTNDIPGETNVVIGIRKDQATLPDGYGFLKGVPAIQRNAYAGGEGGSIFGEAHVTVNNGYIGYTYNAETKEYVAKVDDETWSDHIGKDRLSDCGNVFGGGYDDNSSVDESFVTVWGGVIRNSVFGGGEIATIGRGKVTESGDDNKTRVVSAIHKFGGTNIKIYNGHVRRNVFGGGKGYNILGYGGIHGFYTDGYVFGQTKVFIHGGEIGTAEGLASGYGNVFGGGDVGFVYGKGYLTTDASAADNSTGSPGHIYYKDGGGNLTEDCKVVISPMLQIKENGTPVEFGGKTYGPYDYVPTEYLNTLPAEKTDSRWQNLYTGDQSAGDTEERGVHIRNAVFAGGNVSSNSESYANATTVFGNTTATLNDVYHHDFITVGTEHTGGLYGGGNLSVVGGYRELNITNYGTDYYGLDQQITLEEYQKLTNRERAYFKLEYLCQQDVTIGSKNYKKDERISEDEYNALPAEYKSETYWIQYGFCSIYAGRLLNTIQRADFCGVFGSRLVLQGAKDRVADVADATEYTINRIGELSLNQQRSVAGDTEESKKLHGNYFGIYSVVNYLGSLTSDVLFDDKRRYVEKGVTHEDTNSYYEWKRSHLEKRDRNNGTSFNQVALASGVFLELTTEMSTPKNKVYGDITGVVELDLINVKKDIEGGGYVYARNEHGDRTEHLEYKNVLLSEYNMEKTVNGVEWRDEARTHKRYTYSTTELKAWQTSGNFIHKSKRIVDDCYPNNGIYNDGYTKSPAHYWYIKGEVYIYDQVVSAYAGSAAAYSKEVRIPLTITAGSNGKLKLLNVQPSLYAYYADESRSESNKIGEDGVKVDNESTTYHLNDVISWWDWNQLSDNEQKYFVKETFVNVDTCYVGAIAEGNLYPSGTYVLENDLSAHASEIEPKTAYQRFMELHPNIYDKNGKPVEDLKTLFHPSNNIGHETGYVLTLDMNSPKDWDDWYSPVYANDNLQKIRKDEYNDSGTDKTKFREGPTYALTGESGLYGQREYGKGEIISKEVYDDYTTTVGRMHIQPQGQASAEPAYVALADYGTTQAGNAISQTEYNALSDKSNFDPAMVCINTIQLGDEEYVLLGELVSGDNTKLTALAQKYMDYNNSKVNADKVDLAAALAYIHANLSNAYYITKDGLYGGQYFEAGENYGAIKSWCSLTDARDKFSYNYDALDLLVDPQYRGEGYIEDSYHSPYSDVKSVEYEAVYGGTGTLTYFDNDGTQHTISSGGSIDREQYEKVRNDQMHYTRIQVAAGSDEQTVYIVRENIINNGTPYAQGQDISEKDYRSLSAINKDKVDIVTLQKGAAAAVKYYCYEAYQPMSSFNTEIGVPGKAGSIISETVFNTQIPNDQKYFSIQGSEPTETTTLYVSRESNAKDVTSEKVISVVYQYTYYESDDEGEGVSLVNELHVLNIHLQLESGAPEIGLLNAPPAVLPGNSVGLKAPTVNPGLYEVLTSGWEMFFSEEDAQLHRNGVPFTNNGTPLYWYQNQKVFLAFYSKTYLGKTYSNYVPLTVANYHDLDAIMKDKEHHLYVDHPDVDRYSKIYIDNRDCESDPSKSELDLLKDFFDLSMLSGPAPAGSALDGHANLNPRVAGGSHLEFILNSNVSPKAYTDWTPIGDASRCFSGNLHGDGYTISGLNNSLFGNLCGAVYNLGVTGSFTSAGIVDTGDGYVENCWINTTAENVNNVKAVFGKPTRGSGTQIVNCYYPETKNYNKTNIGRGLATPMTEQEFYNGTVAYDLNGFYLNKRYYDNSAFDGSPVEYNYLKLKSDGTLEEEMSVGKYPSSYAFYPLDENKIDEKKGVQYGYVEDRYVDGDFIYRGGTVPESYDERMRVVHDGTSASVVYSPIWPDDYLYFGQLLTYDYNTSLPHEPLPAAIAKDGGRVVNSSQSNRVYRAPAYFRSSKQDVAHFNNIAYLVANSKPASISSTDVKEAYPNMTAIDFAGHNDSKYKLGLNGDFFYQPLLDIDDNLLDIVNEGETQNLLVYAPSAENAPKTHSVLSTYFLEPAYASYYVDDNTRTVKEAPMASVHGHLVQSDLTANCDHLLVDKQDFNAPIAYTFDAAHRMWHQRKPDRYVDTSKGWESVSLPFTAELVTTHQKGEITHFYSGSRSIDPKSETKIGHEYWLRELTGLSTDGGGEATGFFNYPDATGKEAKTATNTFLWDYYYSNNDQKDANSDAYQQFYRTARAYANYPYVQQGKPYLVGFPGVTYYEFDLSGNFRAKNTAAPAPVRLDQQVITFAAKTGETVEVTDHELQEGAVGPYKGYYFKPNYLNIEAPVNSYIMAADGSKYDKVTETTADRKLSAFRAYFSADKALTRAIKFSSIGSQLGGDDDADRATEGVNISAKQHKVVVTSGLSTTADVRIFNVGGLCVATFNIEPGETIETPIYSEGVYMVHVDGARFRKKLMVK